MISRFICKGIYQVTIRHRDGGLFFLVIEARNHSEAHRKCRHDLALLWSECK